MCVCVDKLSQDSFIQKSRIFEWYNSLGQSTCGGENDDVGVDLSKISESMYYLHVLFKSLLISSLFLSGVLLSIYSPPWKKKTFTSALHYDFGHLIASMFLFEAAA